MRRLDIGILAEVFSTIRCNECNNTLVLYEEQWKPSEYEKWLERHKPNCNRNYTGSSQAMDPEAAQRIWGRSLERNHLVYSVFVGEGDSKAFHYVASLNPYPLVKVRKEECLMHVAKRLKKNLKEIKPNRKTKTWCRWNRPSTSTTPATLTTFTIIDIQKVQEAFNGGRCICQTEVCICQTEVCICQKEVCICQTYTFALQKRAFVV